MAQVTVLFIQLCVNMCRRRKSGSDECHNNSQRRTQNLSMGWTLQFLVEFQEEKIPYSNAPLPEMNHRPTSECQRPRNRVRCGKKKQRKCHKSLKMFPLSVKWCRPFIGISDMTQNPESVKDTYFDTLNNLRNAIKSKHPGLLSRKPCLLHINAKPHTAHLIKFLLKDFKWKVSKHSPYSPDYFETSTATYRTIELSSWIISNRCCWTRTVAAYRLGWASIDPTTAAIDGFLLSPAGGWVTSAPKNITGSLKTCTTWNVPFDDRKTQIHPYPIILQKGVITLN